MVKFILFLWYNITKIICKEVESFNERNNKNN